MVNRNSIKILSRYDKDSSITGNFPVNSAVSRAAGVGDIDHIASSNPTNGTTPIVEFP